MKKPKPKKNYHWYRREQRPPENYDVIAEVQVGLDGTVDYELYRSGSRWFHAKDDKPLHEAMYVIRWRFKTENTMQAKDMQPAAMCDMGRALR